MNQFINNQIFGKMKKSLIFTVLMALAMSGMAQEVHYDFAETIESGQTLYFLKGYYGPQDVMVTYPCYHDTIIYNSSGASTQITTYYYGHNEPSGDLVIPSTIIHNDTTYTITTIGYNAFWKCTNITSLTLPNTLNSIIQGAFAGCTGITGEIVIPNSVTHLGTDAFRSCTSLNSVVFSNALTEIGWAAFKGCTSLEHISPLPESLTRIYNKAFEDCSNLSGTIVIPSQITQIDENVFAYCNISSVVIPESVERIKRMAFASCPLDSIFIPSSVTSISVTDSYGSGAFLGCTHLQSIIVDEANSVYDSRDNCNALIETATNTLILGCKNTIIPNTVNNIGNSAFAGCTELDTITIPNSVSYLGIGAFDGCNSLSTITLPSSVSYISDGALACSGLTSITCKSSNPPTAFSGYDYANSFWSYVSWVNREIPIHIPFGTIEAYRNAPGWNYFSNFIETEMNLEGEWYYEIQNPDGSITYQHLECVGDTLIDRAGKRPKIIVRSNTHYNRDTITEVTREYVYEENGKVYWWNKDLEEFTTLYDLNAQQGDEWEIKVGNESLIMHVDTIESVEYEENAFTILRVSDANDIFSGDIVCGIGHLTSFFPERLMTRGKGYRVDGMRCYWVEGELVFKYGDRNCDEVYQELHHGLDETNDNGFTVYPNPANGVLFVRLPQCDNPTTEQTEYRIANLMGQTLLQGCIDAEIQQIDISALSAGMYFITFAGKTQKFVVK